MPYWKRMGALLAAGWLLLPWTADATVPKATTTARPAVTAAPVGKRQAVAPAARPGLTKKPAVPAVGPYRAGKGTLAAPPGPIGLGNILARAGHVIRNKNFLLPAGYQRISIAGKAQATKNQAQQLLLGQTPVLNIGCSAGDIVDLYWEEAEREGIRPDLAFAQALV